MALKEHEVLKMAAIFGLAGGLSSAAAYYLYARVSKATVVDEMEELKKLLLGDLRQHSIIPATDPLDYTFTRDFMILLFRTMYTYQTIAKEIKKEQSFHKRIDCLKKKDNVGYFAAMDEKQRLMDTVQVEVKEMVFDYFNIITKEYEISYERWRKDETYSSQVQEIKASVDLEFVENKFGVPPQLTKEKTEEIVKAKGEFVNTTLMTMIQAQQANEQAPMVGKNEFVKEVLKFDDQVFIQHGFRKEQIDKAIQLYGMDKERSRPVPAEEDMPLFDENGVSQGKRKAIELD